MADSSALTTPSLATPALGVLLPTESLSSVPPPTHKADLPGDEVDDSEALAFASKTLHETSIDHL